jgi:hypothetical protein
MAMSAGPDYSDDKNYEEKANFGVVCFMPAE